MIAQRGLDLLGRDERDHGLAGDQIERCLEVLKRQQVGEVRERLFILGSFHRRQLGQFAVLGVKLGCRRQLDPIGIAERALGEGRKPPHRLHLIAEQLNPNRPLLGRRKDVQDAAANGELPALYHLLDPLIPGGDQILGDRTQIEFGTATD